MYQLIAGFYSGGKLSSILDDVVFCPVLSKWVTVLFSVGARMAVNQRCQVIPTQLEVRQFEEFVLPHLSVGRRGPIPKLSLHKIFYYVLRLLYLGCQWKELPIEKDGKCCPEIHHTRIYRIWWWCAYSVPKLPPIPVDCCHPQVMMF
ncbi:MAG: hypothetical protein ABL903_07795 [Methylococcales bacterium]